MASRRVAMVSPQGAMAIAVVEASDHGDAPCPFCAALDAQLEAVGIVDVRPGAMCGVCGSWVIHAGPSLADEPQRVDAEAVVRALDDALRAGGLVRVDGFAVRASVDARPVVPS